MLLFIAALDILQGCLFTPYSRARKHKYDLWYKTYSLGIDFSSNLNFALITSEEKRKCYSTVWFPFVILHEEKNYEMKFSVNIADAFEKHLIKSRPVFKWCDQAEAC